MAKNLKYFQDVKLQGYEQVFEVLEKFLEKLINLVYLWILLHTAQSTLHDTKGGGFLKGA